ncbi:MAG: hypothetical protein P1Q69_09410 [Candidatus Thorarchaeota archaeon]|nr:hypothetical protein [Candidatus Thorarchaeota archaeon]
MSDDLVVCPSCEQEVPDGKFCKLCGKLLHESAPDSDREVSPDSTSIVEDLFADDDDLDEVSSSASYPDFNFTINGMDPESMAILFSEAELVGLNKDLDVLIYEISATRQALDLEHADKDLLVARAQSLRTAFDSTKARRSELRDIQGELPLTRALANLEKQVAKMKKLKEVEKKIDESVYEEEKTKLLLRIKSFRKDLKSSLKSSKQWLKGMKSESKRLRREKSRLEAKLKIGDISQTAYDTKMKETMKSLDIIERGSETLEKVVRLAEKTRN